MLGLKRIKIAIKIVMLFNFTRSAKYAFFLFESVFVNVPSGVSTFPV